VTANNLGLLDFDPRELTAEPYEGAVLICPGCQDASVHPYRVEVDRGGEVTEIAPDGVGFAVRKPAARGAIITMEFWCESGHGFALEWRFHKGNTFLRAEPRIVTEETLWRN
jgi:hypothetical protein